MKYLDPCAIAAIVFLALILLLGSVRERLNAALDFQATTIAHEAKISYKPDAEFCIHYTDAVVCMPDIEG